MQHLPKLIQTQFPERILFLYGTVGFCYRRTRTMTFCFGLKTHLAASFILFNHFEKCILIFEGAPCPTWPSFAPNAHAFWRYRNIGYHPLEATTWEKFLHGMVTQTLWKGRVFPFLLFLFFFLFWRLFSVEFFLVHMMSASSLQPIALEKGTKKLSGRLFVSFWGNKHQSWKE